MHLTVSQSATGSSFTAGTTCMLINRPNYVEMAQDANGLTTTIEAQLFCCTVHGPFESSKNLISCRLLHNKHRFKCFSAYNNNSHVVLTLVESWETCIQLSSCFHILRFHRLLSFHICVCPMITQHCCLLHCLHHLNSCQG